MFSSVDGCCVDGIDLVEVGGVEDGVRGSGVLRVVEDGVGASEVVVLRVVVSRVVETSLDDVVDDMVEDVLDDVVDDVLDDVVSYLFQPMAR